MQVVELAGARLNECRKCGGLWVARETFEKICQDREQQEAVLGLPALQEVETDGGKTQRLYIPCPSCRKLMNRTNFAGCSGVVVDWCKEHGTWLDHSEFPKIIAFIREGGLRRAREREKDSLRAEASRLRLQQQRLEAREGRTLREGASFSWGDEPDSVLSFLSSLWPGAGE
jgi:Zn-finger nucleic acid-binding protein